MKIDEYSRLDATALAALLDRGEVSAQELHDCARRAAAGLNPDINAIIEMFPHALHYEQDGLFAGVPFLIKDLVLHAEGIACDGGSRLMAGRYVSAHDSELMARFRRAGLATLGRTTTPELGFNASTECVLHGPTRNPWHLGHSSGGSSGGASAAVAAGIVPVAHANDGGGSIRIPASACGLVGLKPSRGRLPFGPDYGLPLMGQANEFVVTRSVRDAAALLDALEGPHPGEMFNIERPAEAYALQIRRPGHRLSIAVADRLPGSDKADPACQAVLQQTIRTLTDLGHSVEIDSPSYDAEQFHSANVMIWSSFLASAALGTAAALGRDYDENEVEACTRACIDYGRRLSGLQLEQALAAMNSVSRQVAAFYGKYDLLLTPTMRTPPPPIGYLNQNDPRLDARGWYDRIFDICPYTALFNFTGLPAISLPLGMAGELPVGMHFAAPMGGEGTLLQLAAELETAMPWQQRTPAIHASKLAGG